MIYFIELWNPKVKWLSLSKEKRAEYLQNVANATASFVDQGVEILTWSVADKDISHGGVFDYFAIWKFPNAEISQAFQNAVSQAGWYEHFTQINIQGKQNNIEHVLNELVQLNAPES